MTSANDHVFESSIRATPEQLWLALTDGAITQRYYFGLVVESTWEVGAPYHYNSPAGSNVEGEVLVFDAPRRLETTFRALFQPGMADMPPSLVSWVIEPLGEVSQLTLTHRGLDPASPFTAAILGGWSQILADLKTLLETEQPLVIAA